VQRVARIYFAEDNRTVGYFIPKTTANDNGEETSSETGANGSGGD
jgi:hypothetical protein